MNDRDLLLMRHVTLPYGFEAPPSSFHAREDMGPIPKMVHMLWLDEELPDRYKVLHDELRAHNPDWTIKVWSDSSAIHMRNRHLFDAERNPGAKSDIARYEVVYNEGGTYLDVDFKSLGPGSLTERMTRPWVTVSGAPWFNCNNAQFGFGRCSTFLSYVMQNLRDPRVREETCSTRRMGPTFWTTCILSFSDHRFICEDGAQVIGKLEHLAHANWVRWEREHADNLDDPPRRSLR